MSKNQYNKTITACFVGYIVQAIVNNYVPLLFLTFQRTYDIPLSQITLLVTFNFGIQLLVDLLSVGFVDRIGYRASMVLAHVMGAGGVTSSDISAGSAAAAIYWDIDFCNGVCHWRRASGSACEPGGGSLSFRE